MDNKNDIQLLNEDKLKNELNQRALSNFISQEILDETKYFFEDGLRKVKPYHYDFIANAKGRWFGKSLVQVFSQEFQYYTEEKCRALIAKGSLRVDQQTTSSDHIISNGDIIINTIHRHELPVSSERISIVEETEDVLVVNKPPSIPVHPCGRYRHNTLLYILAKEYGQRNLRVVHRLDRLTSGLVILCKTEARTKQLMECIRNRDVQKIYLSKVDGVFPSESIVCDQAIDVLSHKLGIYWAKEGGKASKTTFKIVATDGKTSIVKCEPLTGRTHQIRVHLQYLGYPISNDPIYNHVAWGPDKGKGGLYGKEKDELINDLANVHRRSAYILAHSANNNNNNNNKNTINNNNKKNNEIDNIVVDMNNDEIRGNDNECDDGISSDARKRTNEEECNINEESDNTNFYKKLKLEAVTCGSVAVGGDNTVVAVVGKDSDIVGVDNPDFVGVDNSDLLFDGSSVTIGNDSVDKMKGGEVMAVEVKKEGREKIYAGKLTLDDNDINRCDNSSRSYGVNTSTYDKSVITNDKEKKNENDDRTNNNNNNTEIKNNNNNDDRTNKSDNNKNKNMGYDSDCDECDVECRDPTTQEMFIYLHALSYQGPDWKYETSPPAWATYPE